MERAPTKSEWGPIKMDLASQSVVLNGSENKQVLTPPEYQILWLLVREKGGHVPREEFERAIYEKYTDPKDMPESNTPEVLISRLRKKLNALTEGRVTIANTRDLGYFLELH